MVSFSISRLPATLRATLVLAVIFLLVVGGLRWLGIDQTMASQDSAEKLRVIYHRVDTGSWWFSGSTTIDPAGRSNWQSGYFSGPDAQGRYWSFYVTPYLWAVAWLWPLFAGASTAVINGIIILGGVIFFWRSVCRHYTTRQLAWAGGMTLLLSTLGYYGLFLWEHGVAVALVLIGLGAWWRGYQQSSSTIHPWWFLSLVSFGLAMAIKNETAFFLPAFFFTLVWCHTQRRERWSFALVSGGAVLVWLIWQIIMWHIAGELSLGQVLDHVREPRWWVLWHNLFDSLTPNRLGDQLGLTAASLVRAIIASGLWVATAGSFFIALRRTRPVAYWPIWVTLPAAVASLWAWPYGLLVVAPWVAVLPVIWILYQRSTLATQRWPILLLISGLLFWLIGVVMIPIHGGGQLGPRYFLTATTLWACSLVLMGPAVFSSLLRQKRLVAISLVIICSVTLLQTISYLGNNWYKARYVAAWEQALSKTNGPVIFFQDNVSASLLITNAVRHRPVLTLTDTDENRQYLNTVLSARSLPIVTFFGDVAVLSALPQQLSLSQYQWGEVVVTRYQNAVRQVTRRD